MASVNDVVVSVSGSAVLAVLDRVYGWRRRTISGRRRTRTQLPFDATNAGNCCCLGPAIHLCITDYMMFMETTGNHILPYRASSTIRRPLSY